MLIRPRPEFKVLVVASTFPSSETDEVPAFVRDLVVTLKREYPELTIQVLAPHHRDLTSAYTRHEHYEEFRFRYAFPRGLQQLAGRGIMPALQRRHALALLVPALFIGEFVALLRMIRRDRPDVIHAHWFTPQGVVVAIASGLTGVPFVLTTHASDVLVWEKVPLVGRWVVRTLLPRAERITAVSTATLARARRFFTDPEWATIAPRTRIIPMGVAPAPVLAAPESETPPATTLANARDTRERTVLFIGRLTEKKGVRFLVDALALLQRADVRLVIAGSGPDLKMLESHTARAGLADRVRFPGFVAGERKAALFRDSDILVVPSVIAASGDAEGLPVVLLEGLAAGMVCIATHESGAGDIVVDGENGFLVPSRDAAALAERLEALLALAPKELRRIGDRARESVRPVHWASIARRHYEFLFAPHNRAAVPR